MAERLLLLGDEAIALGALHAGLSGVYAYPGTPSTEITEYIQAATKDTNIHSGWCTNEKTAMEAALGMSYAGKRALVCMKHVGMNVCADAFVNSAMTGVKGGLIVVAADDPSMHSSQNEQDSRFYAQFAMVPIFEPSTQQEAYDMIGEAFSLSEAFQTPVLLRIVTRLAHSRAAVETREAYPENALSPDNGKHWVLLPATARRQYETLIKKFEGFEGLEKFGACIRSEKTPYAQKLILACGIGFNYVMENKAAMDAQGLSYIILKISQYPLPSKQIQALASECNEILVVEDGQPFVETSVRALLGNDYPVKGRFTGDLPRTGELNPDVVGAALNPSNSSNSSNPSNPSSLVVSRPPALCVGCGHRDMYAALTEVVADIPTARVFGDIGCYTLGALPPFQALNSCVDMGASITMAKGAADAGVWPSIAVIGDSTFTHSGMTGLLDAVNDHANITVIISDNLTTAMTGGQDSQGTNKFEAICLGLGVEPEHLHVIEALPKNVGIMKELLRKEFDHKGVSVIIPRRECIQTFRRKAKKS